MRHLRLIFVSLCSFALGSLSAGNSSAAPPDQLGKVNFPTTCSSAVEPTIEKGVALMHSFQYKESPRVRANEVS